MRAWWSWSPSHSIVKQAEALLHAAARSQPDSPTGPAISRALPWAELARWRTTLALGLTCVGAAGVFSWSLHAPSWKLEQGFLQTLWQVEATMVGLGLALIIFALQSGATSAVLRRDLALSLSFPAAINLGLLLTTLLGVALADADSAFGQWLAWTVALLSAAWALALFAAVRDGIAVADPVERIRARRSRLLLATAEVVRRELLRNVSAGILQREVEAAGGSYSILAYPRDDAATTVVRSNSDGQVVDVDRRRLRGAIRRSVAQSAKPPQVWLRLWQVVNTETPIAEHPSASRGVARDVQRAVSVRPARSVGDLATAIETLQIEARLSLGPDTTVLEAVLETFDSVLEAYALGWRRYTTALEDEHVSVFLEGSGVPIDAIYRAVYDLTEAALNANALEAVRTLMFYPARIVTRSVSWRAPAYLRMANLAEHSYAAIMSGELNEGFRRRVAELPWLYLVEILSYSFSHRRDASRRAGEDIAAAVWAIRRALLRVLRRAIEHGDIGTFREGLRRWRIAEQERRTERDLAPLVARVPMPLLWEVARRQAAGKLDTPGEWLAIALGGASLRDLVAAVEGQFREDNRLVDLGDWVSLEMPSHEVHVIDYQSDLLRAFLLAGATRVEPGRPIAPLRVGPGLFAIRDRFEAVATQIGNEASALEGEYAIAGLAGRVDAIVAAYRSGLADHERLLRTQLRSAPIRVECADAYSAGFRKAIADSPFRRFVVEHTMLEMLIGPPAPAARLIARRLVDKAFFARTGECHGATSLGEMDAHSLERAQEAQLVQRLASSPIRRYRKRTLTDRLLAAADELVAAGYREVIFLVPYSWETLSTLELEGSFSWARSRTSEPLGELDKRPLYDLGDATVTWAVAIAHTSAISIREYGPPVASVSEVDDALATQLISEGTTVEGVPSESMVDRLKLRVLVRIDAGFEVQVAPGQVIRVALPGNARRTAN